MPLVPERRLGLTGLFQQSYTESSRFCTISAVISNSLIFLLLGR